jgi:ribonuclease D
LRRILSSKKIAKGLVGAKADGQRFFEDFGISIYGLVDVGLMVKLAEPERHTSFRGGELALVTCVETLFGTTLDKSEQQSKWNKIEELTEGQIKCALNIRSAIK